ncbi:trypanin-like protein [Strigomonas culicis]|uniref:Trypanin-like protein n=3 Tax=Strigomonas culicis TaxID=28005 RepID=S9UGK9_9TRYP|nr:trypanin-like protein [Strigomonas culicis]EPY37016.1 trypanin-like protein [Strigomonas culicis]|eukprot:EPY27889.1 trypanin-like protein [Strigomonas culicis]
MPPKAAKPKAPAPGGKKAASKKPAAAGDSTKGKGKKGDAPAAAAAEGPPPVPLGETVDGRDAWMATDALQKTQAMRNYFQLERDRILSFWDITKRQLEDAEESLRARESQKAEELERHAVELSVFKQKIRNLLYTNQMQMATMKEEAERALQAKEDEYRQLERIARQHLREVKVLDREAERRQREQRQTLVTQQDREIAEQQAQFEREIKEIHTTYEFKLKTVRTEMDRARREEVERIEKQKEEHERELRQVHETTFKEMKDYFGEITSNNLETIRTLKDEVYTRKRTEAHNQKAMYEVALQNKKITEPLAKLQKQRKDLELELTDFSSNKEKLCELKAVAQEAEQDFQNLSWEHEVLTQRYSKLVEDRDIILHKYNTMLQDIQRKSAFRRVLLQKKLELVQCDLEGRDAKLTELLKRANIDSSDVKELEQKVHDLLSEKDKTIEDLKFLLTQMTERGQDIVSSYEEYLQDNGVTGLDVTAKGRTGTYSSTM